MKLLLFIIIIHDWVIVCYDYMFSFINLCFPEGSNYLTSALFSILYRIHLFILNFLSELQYASKCVTLDDIIMCPHLPPPSITPRVLSCSNLDWLFLVLLHTYHSGIPSTSLHCGFWVPQIFWLPLGFILHFGGA